MPDMLQAAGMFEASAKTQRASDYLLDLARGEDLDDDGREILSWVGDLLPQVDWDYSGKLKEQAAHAMRLAATSARPAFYASLVKMRRRFEESGLEKKEDVGSFLEALYGVLTSGGTDKEHCAALGADRFNLAAAFLRELALAILRKYGTDVPGRPDLLGFDS